MEIHIINRIPNGIALGWTYYPPDRNHKFEELTLHLGVIDLRFLF
jgi:hypothetical protein